MTAAAPREELSFEAVYARWFGEVVRWVRALGGPGVDVEDVAQDVFLVVRRKLPGFDGQNLAGWLYRITSRMAADRRRRAWWRLMLGARDERAASKLAAPGASPEEIALKREAQRTLARLLAKLSPAHHRAFALFEIEGYEADEIAALEGVPTATIRTRLFHARKKFVALARKHRDKEPD